MYILSTLIQVCIYLNRNPKAFVIYGNSPLTTFNHRETSLSVHQLTDRQEDPTTTTTTTYFCRDSTKSNIFTKPKRQTQEAQNPNQNWNCFKKIILLYIYNIRIPFVSLINIRFKVFTVRVISDRSNKWNIFQSENINRWLDSYRKLQSLLLPSPKYINREFCSYQCKTNSFPPFPPPSAPPVVGVEWFVEYFAASSSLHSKPRKGT